MIRDAHATEAGHLHFVRLEWMRLLAEATDDDLDMLCAPPYDDIGDAERARRAILDS